MRVAVVDDEQKERETMKEYLTRFSAESGSKFDVDEFSSGDRLLADYRMIYDIILFDVDMPGTNGINTARQIRERDAGVTILFITNMAQYAINAFEVEAADYIIKPVEYFDFSMKFRRAVRRAVRRFSHELTLESVDGLYQVSIPDIIFVEALDHFLTYHFHQREDVLRIRDSIGAHEALLKPYGFCRTHKSYLVNLAHVKVIRAAEVMAGGVPVPIGRRYKKDLMTEYLRFIRG